MMKKIFTLLALFAGVLSASATDQVTVKSVEMAPGAQAKVNLELDNAAAYKGYSFSLTLPTGVSAVTETRKLPTETNATPTDQEVVKVAFTDRQKADNFYVFTKVSGQKVNFVVLPKPEAIKDIAAGSGILMSVFVTVPAETKVTAIPCEEATGAIDKILFTDGSADTEMAANNALKFQTYRLGDATGSDGKVDTKDAIQAINYYLKKPYAADFRESAANVNFDMKDGQPVIDTKDAIQMINIYLGK